MRALVLVLASLLLAAGCGNDAAGRKTATANPPTIARVVSAQQSLDGANIPTLDPATMSAAEIRQVLGQGSFCVFRYTSDGKPVLAWKPDAGETSAVVKLKWLTRTSE